MTIVGKLTRATVLVFPAILLAGCVTSGNHHFRVSGFTPETTLALTKFFDTHQRCNGSHAKVLRRARAQIVYDSDTGHRYRRMSVAGQTICHQQVAVNGAYDIY